MIAALVAVVAQLALGAVTCQWRQTAERILQDAGRAYRIVLVSNNYSAIEPMGPTRLALAPLPKSEAVTDPASWSPK